MGTVGEHAVVLGAGIGGLLAARVLAKAYRRVTVVERDRLPATPVQRRGVPQGVQGHTLLPGGSRLFGELFDGLGSDLEAAGVPALGRADGELHFSVGGHVLRTAGWPSGPLATYVPSRPQLEWQVRRRVQALPNVTLLDGHEVAGVVTDGARVTGVRVASAGRVTGAPAASGGTPSLPVASGGTPSLPVASGGGEELVDAELVVDATGRGARTPGWLEQLGYTRPAEQTVKVDVTYATVPVRLPDAALREKLVLVGAHPGRTAGLGMFRHEDDWWEFTVFGVNGRRPPSRLDELVDTAAEALPPHLTAALRQAEPLGDVVHHRFPASRWRRYDKLRRLPDGLIAFGDAVASFNPSYGQGMSVAAAQAIALASALRGGSQRLPERFYRAAAKPIGQAWQIGLLADRPLVGAATGVMSLRDRFADANAERMFRAAEHDPVVSERFMRVIGLVEPPSLLTRPSTLVRIALADRRRPAPAADQHPLPETVSS